VSKLHVLVVDDDASMRKLLAIQLDPQRYVVESAYDGVEALQKVAEHHPDIVLLDLALPHMDGFEACRKIRQLDGVLGTTWIIVVSAFGGPDDIVKALDAGADVHLTKPVFVDVIHAYIRAGLRRMTSYQPLPPDELCFDNLRIDRSRQRVYLDDQEVHLTATQYRVLEVLAHSAERPMTPGTIISKVWGAHVEVGTETDRLRTCIRDLRRALKDDVRNPRFIFTKIGVGYWFRKPD
jgi:two-component system, OmpR family, KDP operon response regulator KdpE